MKTALIAALLCSSPVFAQQGLVSSASESTVRSLLAQELSFAQFGIQAQLTWQAEPTVGEEGVLRIELLDQVTHQPVPAQVTPSVSLWMPSMGHGSSRTKVQAVRDSSGQPVPGAYLVSGIYFIMDGEWEVRVSLKNATGLEELQAFTLTPKG